jgi:hypothetical protein
MIRIFDLSFIIRIHFSAASFKKFTIPRRVHKNKNGTDSQLTSPPPAVL